MVMLILDENANGEGRSQPVSSFSPYSKVSRPATPFVRKTYEMVNNHHTDAIVSWNSTGNGFIIWDVHKFAAEILPCYFKHNVISSFICQLNTHGFRKASWEKYEFRHEWFQKGKKRWLKNIRRRSNQTAEPEQIQDQLPGEETSMLKMEKEIEEMQSVQRGILMGIKQLQEQQEIMAKELVDMIKNAPSVEDKRRQLPMLMAKSLLETISKLDNRGFMEEKEIINENVRKEIDDPKGKIPEEEEVQKAAGEMEGSNNTRLEKKMVTDDLNMEKMVEERPDIVIGLDDLFEGPVDWWNYINDQMISKPGLNISETMMKNN